MISYNIDPAYMAQVRAIVRNTHELAEGRLLPVEVLLPKGAKLLSVNPDKVKIVANQ